MRGNSSFTRRVVDRYMLAVSALKVEEYLTRTARQASASWRRNNAQFECPVPGCDGTFTRLLSLRDHVRSHIEEYPFVCEWPNCNIGFANRRDCKRHYDLHNSELNQDVCDGCGKPLSRMDALNHLCSDGMSECRKNAASPSGAGPSNANPAPVSAPLPHPPGTLDDYYPTSLAAQFPPLGPPEPINRKQSQFGLDRAARAVPHAVDTGIIPDQAGLASLMHSGMDGSGRPAGPNAHKSTDQFLHARSLPATFSANSSASSHAQLGPISSAISGASGHAPVNDALGLLSLAPSVLDFVPSLFEVELSAFSEVSPTSPGLSSLPIVETSGTTQSQSAGNLASVIGGANSGGGAETLRRQSLLSPMIPGFPTDSAAGADCTPAAVKADYSVLGHTTSLALNDPSTSKRTAAIGTTTPSSKIIDQLVQHGCLDITQDLNLSSCSEYPISQGGFGDVYQGYLKHGLRVAIKCLRLIDPNDDEPRQQKHLKASHVAREIHTWSRLQHPYVLKLLGLAEYRARISMISPWVEGGPLRKFLTRTPGTNRPELCTRVADGLSYLHKCGVIHGDLKGDNVLVSDGGEPLLTDFGNAILQGRSLEFTSTTTRNSLSARWAAPELLRGGLCSSQADIFALGMTILEAMTGDVPYAKMNDLAVIFATATNQLPERPETHIPSTSKSGDILWSLLNDCWASDPEMRPEATHVRDKMGEIEPDDLVAR